MNRAAFLGRPDLESLPSRWLGGCGSYLHLPLLGTKELVNQILTIIIFLVNKDWEK